ncbi:MAG: SDR family oxidoreductase [Acidobacteria bacterium]|nr:SDR family oxidoreductase [Acidobacteriota bacterium]
MADNGSVLVVGGTSEIGKRIAKQYADRGESVIVTSRDAAKAQAAAKDIGGDSSGIALDLVKPHEIGDALGEVGPVKYLVLVAIERDSNMIDDFNVDGALNLFTMKLVGYTEVIHALRKRLSDDSAIVLFGGLAKERPYPGSTTVTTVNGGVSTMIKSLAIQLAPIRVNAIHPAIVGDSPFWAATPPEVLEAFRVRTPLGRLVEIDDVVHATSFLLENKAVNAINLNLDGGWLAM